MELRFSSDDGSREDVNVARLLDKYNFKGTFYIAPFYSRPQFYNLNIREIKEISQRHEIGGHTLSHCELTRVSKQTGIRELTEGKVELESYISKPITKFAYPKGWFNEEVKQWVKEANFIEARTMKMGIINRDGNDDFELPVTAHLYPREEYGGQIANSIIEKFEQAKKEGNYFHLVMHGWEIDKLGLWDELEKILKYIYDNQSTTQLG